MEAIASTSDAALRERLEAVERLVELFRLERYVYLGVTLVSFLVLLGSGISIILREQSDHSILTLLFGSSGLITYSTGRVLWMWNGALKAVMAKGAKNERG